jgi:hypothetical protein
MAIRIAFADDSYLIREAVTKLLGSHEDYSDPEPWYSWH